MTTTWRPDRVTDELVDLSRSLGRPEKDLVILAEGNTSQRLDDSTFAIKTSGSFMEHSTREDFVVTEIRPIIDLISDPTADQAALSALLDAGEHAGARRRASIETVVHAAVHAFAPAAYVAHTHPTPVVALLASIHASTVFDEWVYSDEAVVIGKPLFVPYAEPGIALGRLLTESLREAVAERGEAPSLILLGNHGIVARAGTAAAAEAITLMAVKSARIRLQAMAIGGVSGLGADTVDHYFDREDMAERRRTLAAT